MEKTSPNQNRLMIQCSMAVENEEHAKTQLNELKVFVKSLDKKAVLSGQLVKMLEPCCCEIRKVENNEKTSETP